MKELNELVELAKNATPGPWKAATDWERAAVYSTSKDAYPENKRVVCSGNQNNHKRFNAEPWSGSDWNDAAFIAAANPATILAIAEEFRAMQQRAEAAEAKLAELEVQKLAAEEKLYRQESIVPEGLSRCTAELVLDFATALAEKLQRSEQKYGWSDGWKESDWQDKCLDDFHRHISKGDPRDVAAYCAFMWHHEWPTRPALAVSLAELVPQYLTDALCNLDLSGVSIGDKAIIGKAIEVLQSIEQHK